MIKKLIIVIVILALILSGVYAWRQFIAYETGKFMAKFANRSFSVSVTPVTADDWHIIVPAVGNTIASLGVNVNAEVAGQIRAIYFKSGDIVQQGQPIVLLNPDVLEGQLASDKASLTNSKINYLREQALVPQNAATESDLDSARANYKGDKAKAEQTIAQLNQTLIKAPFTGVLGITQVNLGQYLTAGQSIVSLQALQPMFVDFNVPQNEISAIKVGYPVNVTTVAYPDKNFSGTIVAINSTLDSDTGTLQVRASVDNQNNLLLPNMFADVNVITPQTLKVLLVPQIAVVYSPIGNYVYVIKDNVATRQYISLGDRREDKVAVLKGLTVGDEVVYAGQVKLNNGSNVTVVKE